MNDDMVFCPLVDKMVTIDDCMENRDIKDEYIPEKYTKKTDWKEICNNCKYQKY